MLLLAQLPPVSNPAPPLTWAFLIPAIIGALVAILGYPISYYFIRKSKRQDKAEERKEENIEYSDNYRRTQLEVALKYQEGLQATIERLRNKVEELYEEINKYHIQAEALRVENARLTIKLEALEARCEEREKEFQDRIATLEKSLK